MSTDGTAAGWSEDDAVLVAEFSLGLLDSVEHRRIARRIIDEPALALEYRTWRRRLVTLDSEFAEVAPHAAVLPRIESRLFGQVTARTGRSWWNSVSFWRSLAGVAAAVAVFAVGVDVLRPPPSVENLANELVAALNEQGSDVSFVALYNPSTGSVRLTALSGAPPSDRDFELWAISGSNAPVSMGVVKAAQRRDITLAPGLKAQFGEGTVLAITVEPMGGSPTGAPTGSIVAQGIATPI